MDASSAAQENNETGQSLIHRQTTSIKELESGSRSLSTEEKYANGSENSNKESTEARSIEQFRPLHEDLSKTSSCEHLERLPQDATVNHLGSLPEDTAGKNLSDKQAIPEINHGVVPDSVNSKALVENQKIGTGKIQNGPAENMTVESDHLGLEQLGPKFEDVAKNSSCEQLGPTPEDKRQFILEQLQLPHENKAVTTNLEPLGPTADNVSKNCDLGQLETPPEDAANNPSKSAGRERTTSVKLTKGNHALSSSVGKTRVLRSRLPEKSKAPEQSYNLAEPGDDTSGEKRRKKKHMKKTPVDEFSRIRTHLRYLINRMSYEQSLIDAYSGEGWKGLSLEKIKLENELQRAKSEILRCKLKIRDLFQCLDLSIAEGRLPESLFDSEGEIDSEDVGDAFSGQSVLTFLWLSSNSALFMFLMVLIGT